MPSVSKSQQRLMGVAYAVKSGDMEISDVDPAYRDKVKSMVDGMTKKSLKKYASTKHEDLPETVSEAFIGPYVFSDKMSDEELKAMYFSALDGYSYYQKGMHYAKSDYKKAYQEIEKILKKRGVSIDEDFAHAAQNITPSANIGGMGPVVFPTDGQVGSGDVPAGPQVADIDDDEEEAKKDKTKKKLEMEGLVLPLFTQFNDFVKEATDYNDPVLIRLRQDKLRRADMAKLDALKKEAEKDRKKAMRRWNQKKYDQWLEDVASNGGWENAFDMAQNAEFEPGLVDWVKKENPYDDAFQRIQWDIEAFAESVVTEAKLQDQVEELVRGLDTDEYEVFAFDNDIDPEDANQMTDFIMQLSNKDAKAIIKQLSESVVTEGFSNLKISGPAYDLWNDREVQRKLRGVKIRIVGDIDGVLTVRGHDDELQKVKDIDLCCIESVVTEGLLSDVRKAVEKTKKTLKKKWAAKGGYENFGQDEIRDLEDKYDYHGMVYGTPEERKAAKLIDALDQWAMDYVGESEVIVNEKKLDRDEMMAWVKRTMDFVKTTEEFNGSPGGIWVCGECGDEYKGNVIYAYYSEDYKNRTFGVDNKWEKELNKRGWYSEWHDAGTSMIWPN